jgi:hypothetical protein
MSSTNEAQAAIAQLNGREHPGAQTECQRGTGAFGRQVDLLHTIGAS